MKGLSRAPESVEHLVVEFENGDAVRCSLKELLKTEDIGTLDIDSVKLGEHGYDFVIFDVNHPSDEDRAVHVPWDSVRYVTDENYRSHMESVELEEKRIIGLKMRTFREEKGMTVESVAMAANSPMETILEIENGGAPHGFNMLRSVLKVYGKSLKDLAEKEVS